MASRGEYEKMYLAAILLAVVVLSANLYHYCHPLLAEVGLTAEPLDYLVIVLRRGGLFRSPLQTKGTAMLILPSTERLSPIRSFTLSRRSWEPWPSCGPSPWRAGT